MARKLSMVWNMYDFFTLYAEVDKWEWDGSYDDPTPQLSNPLDIWIVSRLHEVTGVIESSMDSYDIPTAMKQLLPFIEDASNWYVRRSRRRFWKSDSDSDKQDAYRTLHYVLVQLAHVMAPFTPFLAEELYQKLTGGESVHLRNWPATGHVNELALERMAYIREVINEGLSERAAAGIKVRQPLQQLTIQGGPPFVEHMEDEYFSILKEELNVKEVVCDASATPTGVVLNTEITDSLQREGLMRETVRQIQSARKEAGLNVDDHIVLDLVTDSAVLLAAVDEYKATLLAETLAERLEKLGGDVFSKTVTVEGTSLTIKLALA